MSGNMIRFDKDNKRFNYRAVGVMIHNNKVLIHKGENDDFWALPGGRVEFLEASSETLVREMQEELGVDVHVERLLWVAENFFEFEGMYYHEMGHYHLLKLKGDCPLLRRNDKFYGNEKELGLIFKWYPLDRLDELELYPVFLKRTLTNIKDEIEHFIEKDI